MRDRKCCAGAILLGLRERAELRNLVADGATVGAGLTAGDVGTVGEAADDLAAAELTVDERPVLGDLDLVAAVAEALDHFRRGFALDVNALPLDPAPAGGIKAGLRVHAVVDLVNDHLEVALGLHGPAHDAEG